MTNLIVVALDLVCGLEGQVVILDLVHELEGYMVVLDLVHAGAFGCIGSGT